MPNSTNSRLLLRRLFQSLSKIKSAYLHSATCVFCYLLAIEIKIHDLDLCNILDLALHLNSPFRKDCWLPKREKYLLLKKVTPFFLFTILITSVD